MKKKRQPNSTLDLLLRLYAHQEHSVEAMRDRDDQDSMALIRYVNQMANFLLRGNHSEFRQLERLLLTKCSQSLMFAHRLYWFLNAFAHGSTYKAELRWEDPVTHTVAPAPLVQAVAAMGSWAGHDAEMRMAHAPAGVVHLPTPGRTVGEAKTDDLSGVAIKLDDVLVATAGGRGATGVTDAAPAANDDDEFKAMLSDAERAGPPPPTTPVSRTVSFDGALATAGRPGALGHATASSGKIMSAHNTGMAVFLQTVRLFDAMTALADDLIEQPLDRRLEQLQQGLARINEQYLPSASAYLPIAGGANRLLRIHASRSFAFSTKARVPYMTMVEVSDAPWLEVVRAAAPSPSLPSRRRRATLSTRAAGAGARVSAFFKKQAQRMRGGSMAVPPSSPSGPTPVVVSATAAAAAARRVPVGRAAAFSSRLSPTSTDLSGFAAMAVMATTPPSRQSRQRSGSLPSHTELLRTIDDEELGGDGPRPVSVGRANPYGRRKRQGSADVGAGTGAGTGAGAGVGIELQPVPPSLPPPATAVGGGGGGGGGGADALYQDDAGVESYDGGDSSDSDEAGGYVDEAAVGHRRKHSKLDDDSDDDVLERELRAGMEEFASTDVPDALKSPVGPKVKTPPVFSRLWVQTQEEIRRSSPFSRLPGWRVVPILIKSNDDLRQEQFVSQLLNHANNILRQEGVPVWMRAYDILATSPTAGIIEAIPDTVSLHSLKTKDVEYDGLMGFFQRRWGVMGDKVLKAAQKNFVRSLAAYSIISYVLAIKDRHNGNILLTSEGQVVHIDFGFVFTNSPGGNINFESAPFKLTAEFVEVMGGPRSSLFQAYRTLCVRSFLALRKHRADFEVLVEMMLSGNAGLPCFVGGPRAVIDGLRTRFMPGASKRAVVQAVHKLVDTSLGNWRTKLYDKFQRVCQGVL